MVEYGYIEDGYLRTKVLEPRIERYKEDGELKEREVTVEDQIKNLDPKWKPIDPIDEVLQDTERENYTVRVIPYDAGDRISYKYVEVPDLGGIKSKIRALKDELESGDYKVIKCYEASLVGEKAPYNIKDIHRDREILRDSINNLESLLHQFETV